MAEEFQMEYVNADGVRTILATGFIISGAPGGIDQLFQLAAYTDVARISGETLLKHDRTGNYQVYEVKKPVNSEPYREIQARIMMSVGTMHALLNLLQGTLRQLDSAQSSGDDTNGSTPE